MIPNNNMRKTGATNANSTNADPSLEIPFFLHSNSVDRLGLIHPPRTGTGHPSALLSDAHERFPFKRERRREAREANQGRQIHLGVYPQIGDISSTTAIGQRRWAGGGRRSVRALVNMIINGNIIGIEERGIAKRRLF